MSAVPTKPPDRRVERTRQVVRDAFLALMAERGLDEISVQDICRRANIGRSTFYIHFENKDQLLDAGLADLRQFLGSITTSGGGGKLRYPFLRGLIDHVLEQRRLFRSVIGRRSGHVVRTRFRDMILELVKSELFQSSQSNWEQEAKVHYLAGAIFEMLVWLADTSHGVTSDAVEAHFRSTVLPVG